MTYSSPGSSNNSQDNQEQPVDNTQEQEVVSSELDNIDLKVDPYGGLSRGYADEGVSPMTTSPDGWTANIDYFYGCRSVSEERDEQVEIILEGLGRDPEEAVYRLPCKIAEIGGVDDEMFSIREVASSIGTEEEASMFPPGFNTGGLFPYLDLVIEHGFANVSKPDPFQNGVPTYDPANVNLDEEGDPSPQFRLCECINYAYARGWDYVDYETQDPFRGQLEKSRLVKTAPFGPPQSRNNEVNNVGRHQMQSERGFAWFKQKPRKFIYIHPNAEAFDVILGKDAWQSGPSQCDITNDDAYWGCGIGTSLGGKNATNEAYPFHLKYTTKTSGKVMLFSCGHSFNDKDVGGVEGQEYGVCGVSGWMVARPDTCLGGVGQEYYANIGLKYVYAAYRFDSSLKEILNLIAILAELQANAEEAEDAINGDGGGDTRTGLEGNSKSFATQNWAVRGANSGVWERAKEISFDVNDDAHMTALQALLEVMTYSLPENEGKNDKDIKWNLDGEYLLRHFDKHGSLTLYDVYNYAFPRQTIPERAMELLQFEFDIDEYVEQSTDYNDDGTRPYLDELEEKYNKFAFLGWAFSQKGADGVAISDVEDDLLVTWESGMSFKYSEFVDYFAGGWFDACTRCGGSVVANTKVTADNSTVYVDEYRCVKTISVAEPEEGADLGEEEQVDLMTYTMPEGLISHVGGIITDEEIFTHFEVDVNEITSPFTNPNSESRVSPASTRGLGNKYLSTDHEAAQMTDWDIEDADYSVNIYPAIFSDGQPRWSDYEGVAETTQAFRMKRKATDEDGKEIIINEMQRVYNWWNSADDHEFGVTIWCGKDKNSLASKDWELAYVMKGASKGGNTGTIDPQQLLDRKKNPDIQVGRPARGIDRYREYKYFRVTAFSNRRVIGKDENGKNIYAGEKIDIDNWPKGGKKSRVKIWPNTTGLKPTDGEMQPIGEGPAYWASSVYTGGFDNNEFESDWANFGPSLNEWEYWKKPINAISVVGGKTYEFKRVTSGGVTSKNTAPDLNITWGVSERFPELIYREEVEDENGDTYYDDEEFFDDVEFDRAVLTRDMSNECKVYATAPSNADWVCFGAHNTEREMMEWAPKGELWATVSKVPEDKVNTRLISGPMYWADTSNKNFLPPFGNGRWKESLNTFEGHNTAIQIEIGKTYKISRLQPPLNTPYNVSIIQILDEKGLRPRMNMSWEQNTNQNANKNLWKNWYKVEEEHLTLQTNHVTFVAESEWIVFGAYLTERRLDDWSTDGEPAIFGLEEVVPIEGPDYWAAAPINLINNQLIGYPDFTETHWDTPLNPIKDFENQFGRRETFESGSVYDITIPEQISGKKMSFVWGTQSASLDPKPDLELFPTLFSDSQSTGFYPFAYYKRARYDDGNFAEILPHNESEGALTYRVRCHGDYLFFGSHDFRLGYERTLENWETGGEPYDVVIRRIEGVSSPKGPVYWAKEKPDIKDDNFGPVQDGDIHWDSYWWFSPFNRHRMEDHLDENITLLNSIENPEFEQIKPQKQEDQNEYFLYWDADTMKDEPRKVYSIYAYMVNKPLNRSFLIDAHQGVNDAAGKLVRLHYVPEGDVNPVPLVLDSDLHTVSMDDLKKFDQVFQPGDPDYISGSVDPFANVKPGGLGGETTLANKCVTENYNVLHITREIKEENGFSEDAEVSFVFGAYETPEVGATEDTWSPDGEPDSMHVLRINRPMGCVYYGDVIGGTPNNDLAQENTYIDFIDNSDESPWEKAFVDSRFDPGIIWEFEDNEGKRKTNSKATREDRDQYLTMADGRDWRRFRKGMTYRIRLNRGAWCHLTPISADEEMLDWGESDNINSNNQNKDSLLEQHTTVFRDETIKLYAPNKNNESSEEQLEREVEITMDRDYLFFSGHSFDTQRSQKYQQPTDITCWSEKGQAALVTVVYIANNVKGPVYYAGDKSVTWAYEYSLPEGGTGYNAPEDGTGTTANTPQDPSDYGIIDFMNPHWRNSPWNVWKPDIKLEKNKCYEVSIIDFDLVNPDDTVVGPGGKKPIWQDKFSMWFLHKLVNPEIKDINRAFYLEPSNTIPDENGNYPAPGDPDFLEPEYIILDGNSQNTGRWSAMFRCITENVVFGVHRDAGSYVSHQGQPENSDGTTPDVGKVEDFNKAGVPGYFWIREVPDPDAETPTGVAYWAQSNNQKEIEWGNNHWEQPLNTVAPGRIAQGKWYKITAEPDMDRNNIYRIWWSNDDTGRDGKHMGNTYVPTRYGKNEKYPDEPFEVIKFDREVIVYAEGQHMFFAAYNTTRDRIENWDPDGEPAPVKVVEVDPPLDFIQGSVYYIDKDRVDIWDGLPDFQDEHWAKINTYQEITHRFPTGPNDNDIGKLTKFFLKDDYVYRFHKVTPYGKLDSATDWQYNSAKLYDCTLWGVNDRKGIQAGPENNMRHDKIVEVPASQNIIDLKKVEHNYYMWGALAENKELKDWAPFGQPFLADIEEIGHYDDLDHGPAYWCGEKLTDAPPLHDNYWLRTLNYFVVIPGEKLLLKIIDKPENEGTFQPFFISKEQVNKYDDGSWEGKIKTESTKVILAADGYHFDGTVTEAVITVPEDVDLMMFGNRKTNVSMNQYSPDGRPIKIIIEKVQDPEGPGYFADNIKDVQFPENNNIPDFKDPYWKQVTPLTMKRGRSYRFRPVVAPEENPMKYEYKIIGHYGSSSLEVGTAHGGQLKTLGSIGPDSIYVDLKAVDTTEITFGTKDAEFDSRTQKDWSPRGEHVPITIYEFPTQVESGPVYHAADSGVYETDYNNVHWMSPLNWWIKSSTSQGDVTRLAKNKRYKITALPGMKGNCKLWFGKDENAFRSPKVDYKDWETTGTIISYESEAYPTQTEFTAPTAYMLLSEFGVAGRKIEDFNEDGEPAHIKLEEIVYDDSIFGPVYWNDRRESDYSADIFANEFWQKLNHVPLDVVRPYVGLKAEMSQKTLTQDRKYDLDVWFAKNGKQQMDNPKDPKYFNDWIKIGTWKKTENKFIIPKVEYQYIVFTTQKVADRDDNTIEGWSPFGEPLDVKLEEIEEIRGPMYWADYKPSDPQKPGMPYFRDSYWKELNFYQLPAEGVYKISITSSRKSPYDLNLLEAKGGMSPNYYEDKKNWRVIQTFRKNSSRAMTGRIENTGSVYCVGAWNTLRQMSDWSNMGEPITFNFKPENDDTWGQILYGHDNTKQPPRPFPLHGQSYYTMPAWSDKNKWKDGFMKKAFPFTADSEAEPDEDGFVDVTTSPLKPLMVHKFKLKKGSGPYKLEKHTYMSVWGVSDKLIDLSTGTYEDPYGDHNTTAKISIDDYEYFGDVGIPGQGNPKPGGGTGSFTASSSRAKSNKGGGGNNGGGGGGDGDVDNSGRNRVGKKLEFKLSPLKDAKWLLFGQYYAPKDYSYAEWPIHGKPVSYSMTMGFDVNLKPWQKLLALLLKLISAIPNIISLFQELDILIEQNERHLFDEMDFSENGRKSMKDYCRWREATPLYFNTTCDQTNRMILRLLKLRYNGLFIHANSEKPHSTSNNTDKWKGMTIMNLTPTFQHGIGRMYNDKAKRVLRFYSPNEGELPRINGTWGRQSETFLKLDTRVDTIKKKSNWDDRLGWFNVQLAWGVEQLTNHYYKVKHGLQYRSATRSVTVGSTYNGEISSSNVVDGIFTDDGFMMKAVGFSNDSSKSKCATFEIMAGADTVWPLNCGPNGISLDPDDDTQLPYRYYPGIEFDFDYGKFYSNPWTDDFQILDIFLYFMDPETQKVRRVEMVPEKSSKYMFRRVSEPESNSGVKTHKMSQNAGQTTKIRCWQAEGYQAHGEDIFYKMTVTIYMGTASSTDTVHAMIMSNLRPLGNASKPTEAYLIKNKSDLDQALAKDYPTWPNPIEPDEPDED